MTTRQRWLALVLVITLVAAFWPAREDDSIGVVEPVKKEPLPSVQETPAQAIPTQAGREPQARTERLSSEKAGNLFPRQTWVPPPPPPPKPKPLPPPPPPSPPPLPFSFLGRWVESGEETYFLAQGDRIHHVRKGDVVVGSWRLDGTTPNQLTFTYLPLDMTRTLRITP